MLAWAGTKAAGAASATPAGAAMPTKVATVAPASSLRTQCLLVEVVMPELPGAPSDWAGGAGWAGGGAPAAVPA